MAVPYLDGMILHLLNIIDGQRTIYSPLHILNGKKSSQPIQDSKLYGLTEIFGVLPRLKRNEWDYRITLLQKDGKITEVKEHVYKCTDHGLDCLMDWKKEYPHLPNINGWKYKDQTIPFWRRLNLLIQTTSCLIQRNNRFIPVQRNANDQQFIKNFIRQWTNSLDELADQLFEELMQACNQNSELGSELFVMSLSGNHRTGWTIEQSARKLKIDVYYAQCLFVDTLHFFIQLAEQPLFPILNQLATIDIHQGMLTASTQKTLTMIRKGRGKEEIAQIRKLKINTVEDHIVEIASFIPDFSIHPFVTDETKKEIEEAIERVGAKQLRTIKANVSSEISYFQIRLVLACKRGRDI